MKYKSVLTAWLHKALELEPGEEILLPCESEDARKVLLRQLLKEQNILAQIDPEGASKLRITKTLRHDRLWVAILRIYASPLVGFKISKDGKERITISA